MSLLHYEFIDGPDESINGMLRTLVRDIRYNRSYVPIDEFKRALTGLKAVELRLQNIDSQIGEGKRDYIQEIMAELDLESKNEELLIEDLSRAPVVLVKSMLGNDISIADFNYQTGRSEHYNWLQFFGYKDERPVDANLIIVREIFRSICYKYDYVFVNLS